VAAAWQAAAATLVSTHGRIMSENWQNDADLYDLFVGLHILDHRAHDQLYLSIIHLLDMSQAPYLVIDIESLDGVCSKGTPEVLQLQLSTP